MELLLLLNFKTVRIPNIPNKEKAQISIRYKFDMFNFQRFIFILPQRLNAFIIMSFLLINQEMKNQE